MFSKPIIPLVIYNPFAGTYAESEKVLQVFLEGFLMLSVTSGAVSAQNNWIHKWSRTKVVISGWGWRSITRVGCDAVKTKGRNHTS